MEVYYCCHATHLPRNNGVVKHYYPSTLSQDVRIIHQIRFSIDFIRNFDEVEMISCQHGQKLSKNAVLNSFVANRSGKQPELSLAEFLFIFTYFQWE